MKKIRIEDDDDVVEKEVNKQIIASVILTKEQKKIVFGAITKVSNEYKEGSIKKDQVWKHINNRPELAKSITSKTILDRAIIELQDDNKILFEADKNEIYII